ncbi:coiled-coil domain-containing protein [Trypanosoma rangeli]|uniref:Coiled-coil domain-containing protein n=1 Tax=Trypanosoma rangeli TaxID=5698 RepID=A0A3R7NUX3_TRYRA|nr:coiled-coil domain-containing protein [Trypanosoma rangeli]RNF12182.1 coiled-coil domain-containing protein [Trypanosoma rangeli]|eukprot:RNF12182.1 coiled-coil domain-containing protein [Trypanosoma rangeli]
MASHALAEVQREHEFMQTADAVNKFIISTTQFLNRFAAQCDNQLFEVSRSLQRLEILTLLLENKLNSVDDDLDEMVTALPTLSAAALSQTAAAGVSNSYPLAIVDCPAPPPMPGLLSSFGSHQHPPPPPPPQRNGPPPPPGAVSLSRTNVTTAAPLQPLPPVAPSMLPPALPVQLQAGLALPPPPPMPLLGGYTMCTHPRLQGYFQMLALRVPIASVKAKMQMDGHKPEWLDTPDAVAPTTIPLMNSALYDSD